MVTWIVVELLHQIVIDHIGRLNFVTDGVWIVCNDFLGCV